MFWEGDIITLSNSVPVLDSAHVAKLLFLAGTASNFKNGLGYVVGITSKLIPYKTCFTRDSSNHIRCPEEGPFL